MIWQVISHNTDIGSKESKITWGKNNRLKLKGIDLASLKPLRKGKLPLRKPEGHSC